MLTGALPFSGETLGELLLQICAEPLPLLRARAPALPPSVEDWFQKACARMPDDRYQTAQVLVEALRVAAGISAAGPSDPLAAAQPSPDSPYGSAPGDASRRPFGASSGVLPAPSTTAGTTIGADSPSGVRGRRVVIVAAAVVGLAAVPTFALVVHGRASPDRAPASPVAASSSAEGIPTETEAGRAVLLAPFAGESASGASSVAPRPPASARAGDRSSPLPARPPSRPPSTPTPAKPAGVPSPTPKPTGAIDLGY
jgi:serine/threonine-protein kinase